MKRFISIMLAALTLALCLCGCGKDPEPEEPVVSGSAAALGVTEITVTSDSIDANSYLRTACCAVDADPAGQNLTPQLSWTPVEGASLYAVYMIDKSANDWLHWHVDGVTGTSLALGQSVGNSEYIGPYPPEGTHEYKIIVYALAAEPVIHPGIFNSENDGIESALDLAMDRSENGHGNMLGKGYIIGVCTTGVTVD